MLLMVARQVQHIPKVYTNFIITIQLQHFPKVYASLMTAFPVQPSQPIL